MTAGNRRTVLLAGDPADLLPLVFADRKRAVDGAQTLLATRPSPFDASIGHQVIGIVEREYGDAGAAVVHLRKAARLAGLSGSADREGDVLASLGLALVHLGRTNAGLSNLARAVERATGLTSARVRFRLAAALWVLGRHEPALEEIRRALPVLRRRRDTIWIARTLTLRGLIRVDLGATERADRDFSAAERLSVLSSQAHEAAFAVHNRGIVALRAGDLPVALGHLDEAGLQYTKLGTPSAELSLDRCAALLAAGLARDALAEADAAIRELDHARGQRTRRAELLHTAARAALDAGDARTAHERATAAARVFAAQHRDWWTVHSRLLVLRAREVMDSGDPRLVRDAQLVARRLDALGSDQAALAHLLTGRVALAQGRLLVADRHLAVAARARYHGPALGQVVGWLAEALRRQAAGRPGHAMAACRAGLRVLHQHRLTLGAAELRAQASAHGAELVALALRTCLEGPGSARRLLVWGEHWRATALAVPPVRPPDDRHLQAELARYRALSTKVEEAMAAGGPVASLHQDRMRAEQAIRSATLRVSGTADSAPETDRPLDVAALCRELDGAQLVELVEVDGRLHVLLCHKGRVQHVTGGTLAEIAVETDHTRAQMRRLAHLAAVDPAETLAGIAESGAELERLLLGDAAGLLGDAPLVIVPPARLHAVPWALLPSLFGRTHDIAPSARAWLKARRTPPPRVDDVVLVRGPGLSPTADEVEPLARLYQERTVVRDGDATTTRVLEALDGSSLAHLAAHGTFRADSPLFSALGMVDGPLTAYDLEGLRRAPHRLILPCCDSARLADAGSDELLGLATALIPLGTVGIVGGVVPVNDEAAVPLMLELHRGLRRGLRLAEALRDARIATTSTGDPVALATAWTFVAFGGG